MAKFRYEMFAHLVYDDALSYEELIEREQPLMSAITAHLQDVGASYIDFQQLGDALDVQCVFAEQDAESFASVSATIAELTGEHVSGRVVFLGRDLEVLYPFYLVNGVCAGGALRLPHPVAGLAKARPDMQYLP